MSTRELYLGGARQQNNNYAMFPAAAFVAGAPVDPMNKEQPVTYLQARDLDFTGETALARYNADFPIVSGDVVGSVVIPSNFLALGYYWRVGRINAGGTFALSVRTAAVSLLTATTTGTLNSNAVPWPTAPLFFKNSDILDVTFPTVPAGGLGPLDLQVGVFGWQMRVGNW